METNENNDLYSDVWCRRKRFPNYNPIILLKERELGKRREGSHFIKGSREFYNTITLTKCIHAADLPQFIPLAFSPDGNMLVGLQQTFQNAYFFSDPITIYFFPQHRSSAIGYLLSRECSFFTYDSRHLILASVSRVTSNHSRIKNGIQRNNESLEPGNDYLNNYKFYCICLKSFNIMDEIHFGYDYLSIRDGVHMIDRQMIILSVLHQTIYVYYIDRHNGTFIPQAEFGRTLYNDSFKYVFPNENPITETVFTGLLVY